MVISPTRLCVACKDPVQGIMNGDILCNDCMAFQMATMTKRCPMCDTDIPNTRDLCDVCIETLKDSSILKRRRTDTLKLYKLYVNERVSGVGQPYRAHKSAVMYVLGKSEPSTVESTREWLTEELGDWTADLEVTSIKELEGPFDHGHVIHYGETDG